MPDTAWCDKESLSLVLECMCAFMEAAGLRNRRRVAKQLIEKNRINPGAEAMEAVLTPGASTPAHDRNTGDRLLHRINYYGTLQLQDGAHKGIAQPRPYEEELELHRFDTGEDLLKH
ncbi:UNVERIFIED_CONTAM: hypothetical protein FKN15_020246 [Acipenser sinensis]